MTFLCYNTRLYKAEGRVTPEIKAVADYALENIGDCTGDQDHIYLTLRVSSLPFYSVFMSLCKKLTAKKLIYCTYDIFICCNAILQRLLETWLKLWVLPVLP